MFTVDGRHRGDEPDTVITTTMISMHAQISIITIIRNNIVINPSRNREEVPSRPTKFVCL